MSNFEGDVLRDLMVRATEDLAAPRGAATHAIRRQRRRRTRIRVLGAAGTAAAAGLAVGVLVPATGRPHPPAAASPSAASLPPVQLTAAQRELFSLSAIAAATPRPDGRYVVLKEVATSIDPNGTAAPTKEVDRKTSVIDTLTGGGLAYQDVTVTNGDGTIVPPRTLTAPPGSSPTRAQLDAMPTGAAALGAALLAQAEQQQRQAQQFMDQRLKKLHKGGAFPVPKVKQRPETADDLVFEQAADLLWEPHLSPQLRAGLYKVLAATPGVVVRPGASDSSGRPATEISRLNSVAGDDAEVFVDPTTGQTIESAWAGPGAYLAEDLYSKITYTNTIPADPYHG